MSGSSISDNRVYGYAGRFEVHLTLLPTITGLPKVTGSDVRFAEFCNARQLRPLHILLARGNAPVQPMVTFHRDGTLSTVRDAAEHQACELSEFGFPVTRIKIEADVTNEDVPELDKDAWRHSEAQYFEHHVKLHLPLESVPQSLLPLCERHQGHLSRNSLRRDETVGHPRFVTLRHYGIGRNSSERRRNALLADLETEGYEMLKIESEYCVYDSNVDLDAGWLVKTEVE